MSEQTPRTDAAYAAAYRPEQVVSPVDQMRDFARQLERELTASQAALKKAEEEIEQALSQRNQTIRELANEMERREAAEQRAAEMEKALHEGRRAIGSHIVPEHCYSTGPMTGDAHRDLVECPACSFIAMYEAVIGAAREGK